MAARAQKIFIFAAAAFFILSPAASAEADGITFAYSSASPRADRPESAKADEAEYSQAQSAALRDEPSPFSEEDFFDAFVDAVSKGNLEGFLALTAPAYRALIEANLELCRAQFRNWGRGLRAGNILSIGVLRSGDIRLLCALTHWKKGERLVSEYAFDLGYKEGRYLLLRIEPDIFIFPSAAAADLESGPE